MFCIHRDELFILANKVPSLNVTNGTTIVDERHYINLNVNVSSTFTVYGIDDGEVSYEFANTTVADDNIKLEAPRDDGSADVTLTLKDINPVYVRYITSSLSLFSTVCQMYVM
jgi:hypothetical protein